MSRKGAINMKKVKLYGVELEINELTSTCDTADVWPKLGDMYWHLTGAGNSYSSAWGDYMQDFARKRMNNCYRTKQEAHDARDYKIATAKVLSRLRELEAGELVEWGNYDQSKHAPQHNSRLNSIVIYGWYSVQVAPTEWYSTDKDAWLQVLKEMPKEVKLMIRGER